MDELRSQILASLTAPSLLQAFNIELVQVARFRDGALEIEFRTIWASRDRQPSVSHLYATAVGALFDSFTPAIADTLAGEEFRLVLRS